jgi:hypothetical protein
MLLPPPRGSLTFYGVWVAFPDNHGGRRRHVGVSISIHLSPLPLVCLLLALVRCGGEPDATIDQLVHDGPVARPPPPVALHRDTGRLVAFSSETGVPNGAASMGLSLGLRRLVGHVVDLAAAPAGDADGGFWAVLSRDGRRWVARLGPDGVERWSRLVPGAGRVVPFGSGGTAVLGASRGGVAGSWWGLGADGEARWKLPSSEPVAGWSSREGAVVVARGQSPEDALVAWDLSAHHAPEGRRLDDVPADSRFVALDTELVSLRLRNDALVVTTPSESYQVPAAGASLVAARASRGQIIALFAEPAELLVIDAEDPSSAMTHRLDHPIEPGRDPLGRRIGVNDFNIFAASEDGVVRLERTSCEAGATCARDVSDFDGAGLEAPLAVR